MKLAIIGAGNLGIAIAEGLITTNAITTLYLTRRNPDVIQKFEEYKGVKVTSDILFFAVQPSQFEAILHDVKDLLNEKHVLISTITGFTISRMESIIGTDHYIIRSMPNTAISVGKSMTC